MKEVIEGAEAEIDLDPDAPDAGGCAARRAHRPSRRLHVLSSVRGGPRLPILRRADPARGAVLRGLRQAAAPPPRSWRVTHGRSRPPGRLSRLPPRRTWGRRAAACGVTLPSLRPRAPRAPQCLSRPQSWPPHAGLRGLRPRGDARRPLLSLLRLPTAGAVSSCRTLVADVAYYSSAGPRSRPSLAPQDRHHLKL